MVASDAQSWEAVVTDSPRVPPRLIVVEKTVQKLHLYERKSPLKLQKTFLCTTGQKTGDKVASGDLRTPEGVYFVVDKIDRGLNFQEYGGIAHTLNYPNPVDKLHGKTGHGIWIHSRGRPITPLETKGCIALDLSDIDQLGAQLPTGTAVVVADTVRSDASGVPKPDGETSAASTAITRILEQKTRDWNAAWAGREKSLFEYYWPEAYTKAQGESFQSFRSQKEKLFATLPWVQIIYGDIQVLQGPDYWVSWFSQYYRAPNLSTEGIRRLYWQPDNKGELRIVGMEWVPMDLGMETSYLETVTPNVTAYIERWRKAWLAGDVKGYGSFYAPAAKQGGRTSAQSIMQHKQLTWAKNKPVKVELTGLRVMIVQNGVKVDMMQSYRDSTGYQDKGVKTVLLQPRGNDWSIVSEDWSAAP
ncbi:MAG: L,D-transpeptidase family protein [Bilophila sp.]